MAYFVYSGDLYSARLMFFKSIFQGNLQFGNEKSYHKVIKMFDHRVENYYKSDVLFKVEDIFKQDSLVVQIPRTVTNITEKNWKNTVDLFQYVAQFAIAGNIGAWMTEEGKILKYAWIEPKGDKAVVQKFLKGRSLISEKGKEKEAEAALSKAIELYDSHAQAYERRGYVNFLLKKHHDAERDFTKSIKLDPSNSPAYYGRAKLKILKEDWEGAIQDLELAIKTSLALQDIHWSARRQKGECHQKLQQYEEAEFEFRFFNRRTFKEKSYNYAFIRQTLFNYGKVLLELGKFKEALEVFEKVMKAKVTPDGITEADILVQRGIARKNAGKNGFISDWNAAKKLGSAQADRLLQTTG
ncbi:MAG: tetratricopeptide repeat protein [Saprospiraceae bacterium]|nr:tetratricopeptide repeat protein [Saprospiraceae bacterium]